MTRGFDPRRVFLLTFAAVALVQAGWILAVPAFRGSDEFDHVYKAASVVRGQWTAREPAPHGRGGIVTIPRDIVTAASAVCRFYHYTGHDNCFPINASNGSDVQVATAANSYNPAYYVVTGLVSKPFHGDGVDYAMRIVTALGSALLMAWAAAITARWATTAWPLLAMAAGFTPVLLYSTSIAAPNGLTYAAAALVWWSIVALARRGTDTRGLALPLTVGCATLVATHTTGLMWLAVIAVVSLVLHSPRDWVIALRARPKTWAMAATATIVAAGLCLAWIRFAHTNTLGSVPKQSVQFPWSEVPVYQVRWVLQSIAAFPLRRDPAPAPVYVLYGLVLLAMVVALYRHGTFRERAAAIVTVLAALVVPTALTVVSYATEGVAWQGRYCLPLWVGVSAIAGVVLDRRPPPSPSVATGVAVALAAGMAVSTCHLALHEAAKGPADPLASAFPGGFALTAVLPVAGFLLLLLALRPVRDERPEPQLQADEAPLGR